MKKIIIITVALLVLSFGINIFLFLENNRLDKLKFYYQDRTYFENKNGVDNEYYEDVNFDGYLDLIKRSSASGSNFSFEVYMYNTSNGEFNLFSREFTEAISGSEFELVSNLKLIRSRIQNGYAGYVIRMYKIENGLPKLLNQEEIKN